MADKGKTKKSVRAVCGKIAAINGEEVPGASITVVETGETAYADLNGNFNLNLEAGKTFTIRVNSLGYMPVEISSNKLSAFSEISLQEL